MFLLSDIIASFDQSAAVGVKLKVTGYRGCIQTG